MRNLKLTNDTLFLFMEEQEFEIIIIHVLLSGFCWDGFEHTHFQFREETSFGEATTFACTTCSSYETQHSFKSKVNLVQK